MSFGEPHNPYGQQPPQAPQGQPGYGYGYPQQAPQGIPPQGGYAYPQQAPQGYPGGPGGYPGGPGGYPGAQMEMPGGAKAARVILWIVGALQVLGGLFVIIGGAVFAAVLSDASSSGSATEDAGAIAGTVGVVLGIFFIGLSVWPILTAAKMAKGRGGVRVSGIIFGSLQSLFAVFGVLGNLIALSADENTPAGLGLVASLPSLVSLALGLTIVIGLAKAGDYFRRPQY
ncbi:hypothetical protein Snoj_77730 [Streptomyces nojiriensis]|uniref:Integral membrane protein n=1 Tax=Streptomyces nojiriensis TaxID=66374 RepID=A0ABQ3T0D2_9ACTN|nr:hypothetical protein [Streptomyces nojiriensis]QTI47361.1 hypothetical protein JYK04_05210 [Streptomyces nojiriensis]GGR78813.1 hypothetical protein GCM10010205_04580 [Streptomyces nojiriensis]GHI73855.1 hypothetical protein Snoj_77730 [Streptomyces nojiriensis]